MAKKSKKVKNPATNPNSSTTEARSPTPVINFENLSSDDEPIAAVEGLTTAQLALSPTTIDQLIAEDSPLEESHPALRRLEGGQKQSAMLMLDSHRRVVAQQAPPGSGKTFTLASIVAALLEQPDLKILCMAPLNVAVIKICEELVEALKVEGVGVTPLALFSGNGKIKYREQLDRISANLLEAAITSEEFWRQLDDKMRKDVKHYQAKVRKRPRVAKEARIAELVLQLEERRVICCTLGFAEQVGRLITDRNIVVLDESGQAPFAQTCATLSHITDIRKLFITGDKFQLAVNMKDVPEEIRSGFGLDTILINTDNSKGVDKTTLQTNYRSHPQIVQCIEHSAYKPHGEVLKPGPGIFRALIDYVKLPVPDSPIVLIHQDSPMETEAASFSATNSGQTRTVVELLHAWRAFRGSVSVISLYSGQAGQIGAELRRNGLDRMAQSCTADSMQGHESDLVIVVTTVSRRNRNPQAFKTNRGNEFWGDTARVNVACSRGKHGIVLVGNLLELAEASIWRRFLKKSMELTIVTTPQFIQVSVDPHARYIRGTLTSGDGLTVQDFRFYAEWNKQNFQPTRNIQTVPNQFPSPSVRFFRPPPPPRSFHDQWPNLPPSAASPQHDQTAASTSNLNRAQTNQREVHCWKCHRKGMSQRNATMDRARSLKVGADVTKRSLGQTFRKGGRVRVN